MSTLTLQDFEKINLKVYSFISCSFIVKTVKPVNRDEYYLQKFLCLMTNFNG